MSDIRYQISDVRNKPSAISHQPEVFRLGTGDWGLPRRYRRAFMIDLLGLDTLLAQMILALGGALVVGNGYALIMARRGVRPKGAEGDLRKGRAWFLLGVGLVIAFWGAASLIAR